MRSDGPLRRADTAALPTAFGTFQIHAYEGDGCAEHAALTMGDVGGTPPVLVRVHSSCRTGDSFASLRCDCGPQLHAALTQISAAGRGVVVHLDQEGRGIGLPNKIRAYALQDQGLDTVDANHALGFAADLRVYDMVRTILDDLGVRHVRLLTNNPRKVDGLTRAGVSVTERVPLITTPNEHNRDYLATKAERMDHDLQH